MEATAELETANANAGRAITHHKNSKDWATGDGSSPDATKLLNSHRAWRTLNDYNSDIDCIVYSLYKYCENRGIQDLGYTRVHGRTRYNDAKNAEIKDRVSM